MSRFKEFPKNLGLMAAGVITAFVILEIFLRIFHPFEFRVRGDKIVLPANAKYIIKNDKDRKNMDAVITHRKNSLGFRGEEPPKKFKDFMTIITVGGSTTECFYLSDGRTWPDRLEKKLKNNFRYLWLNNAGLDGHSTYGHLVLMQDYIIKIKPKVVLFYIGCNDMAKAGPSQYDKANIKNGVLIHNVGDLVRILADNSEVFLLGLNIYRNMRARERKIAHDTLDFSNIHKEKTDAVKKGRILEKYKETYLKDYESRLETLIDISRRNGVEPVFITQAALYGNAVDDVTGVNLGTLQVGDKSGGFSWEILEAYNDVTRKVSMRDGVLCIDLASEMPKSSAYYYDFYHFNNMGADKAADIIYRHLYPFLATKYPNYFTH